MARNKDMDFFGYAAQAQSLLSSNGVCFHSNGFPDLRKFRYPNTIPDDIEVWPYSKRNQAINPRKTVLTFFEDDWLLYGYLNSLDKVAANLGLYYGVTGFDLSPCLDFSIEEQNAFLLINSLTNGLFLMNGIQVIPSLRIGGIETLPALKSYPQDVCYAFGALGCGQRYQAIGRQILSLKLAFSRPNQVLAYGRLRADDERIFRQWNVPILNVIDYQTRIREKSRERTDHHV